MVRPTTSSLPGMGLALTIVLILSTPIAALIGPVAFRTVFWIAVGVASVIMIIIGGIRFVTSGGDSTKVNSARNTIIYAIVGIFVALLAQSIIVFIFNKI